MFGTFEKFDLVRVPFARCGSNTFVDEDFDRRAQLRLGNNWNGTWIKDDDFLFDIKLTVNGAPVKYSYFADEGSLKLSAGCGEAEIALTDRSHLRIRGKNAGLRLELRSGAGNGAIACRGIFALADGSGWEGEFGRYGKLFVKALSGSYAVTARFDEGQNRYSLVRIDFLPAGETGGFDAAIHDYRDGLLPYGGYENFDELVENNRADFASFRTIYPPPAPGYEAMAKYAQWTVWTHRTKAIGRFKQPHIVGWHWSSGAAPWQQSYNAMPMLADLREAWRQICVMFLYQDGRTGLLPNGVTYSKPPMPGMQPAFQGFALDYLFRKVGDGFITPDEAERIYPKMAAWADYWTTYRNAGLGSDLIAIANPNESGWDDSTLFKDGFPAVDPCTLTFEILMMEAVAVLAKKSRSYTDRRESWAARAKKLTDTLIGEYWDGEKFVSKVNGQAVDSLSLASFQPIILGRRLPQDIIDKIAEKLMEEGAWLTDIGLASESMRSELTTFGFSFVLGRVVGPQNMIISVGLQAAGKQKEAEIIARRFCGQVDREGMILGFAPYNYYKHNGEKARQQRPPHQADGWYWSSWTANCYLTMVTGVIGQ